MIGEVYAAALMECTAEPARVRRELELVAALLREQPRFLRLLSDPGLSRRRRRTIVEQCFGGILREETVRCIALAAENGHARHLPELAEAFAALERQRRGTERVEVLTAVPLTQEQRAALVGKLRRVTGRKIELSERVEPSVLGGVRLKIGDRTLDGTLLRRLKRMEREENGLAGGTGGADPTHPGTASK